MEILRKKNIVLKIVIALVIVILFNFSAPTISHAGLGEIIGGTLLTPIVDLILAIGDGLMYTIQKIVLGMDSSLIKVSNEFTNAWAIVAAVAAAALVIGVAVITGGASLLVGAVAVGAAYATYSVASNYLPPTFNLPVYAVSPEEIFSNQLAILDVNFFNPNTYEGIQQAGITSNEQISTAGELQSIIASWYLMLRNFALIVLLSVLLYTGINIIISSSSQDKAKYKEKLFDWFVGICLLFFLHYIMAFATTVVQEVTTAINRENGKIEIILPDLGADEYYVEAANETTGELERMEALDWFSAQTSYPRVYDENSKTYRWYTNLMGYVRLQMQLNDPSVTEDNELLSQAGYTILFVILVFYTVAFLVVYLKRLIMLAFLTMIAPLVAMTYPLDKMRDGKAQAFNLWIKEYVFNLLIQPFHLILYTMLVGSAMDFARKNIIYAIVAVGFIFQAEKILRKFFGFDSASTISNGSAIGGALAMAGIGALRRITGGSKSREKGGKGSGNSNSSERQQVRTNRTNELLDEQQSGQNNNQRMNNGEQGQSQQNDDQENSTPQQSMLDAYDENYGTDDWDPQERDAMAREAYAQDNSSGMDYSADEYAQALRDSGYGEDEIQQMMSEDPRYAQTNEQGDSTSMIDDNEASGTSMQGTNQADGTSMQNEGKGKHVIRGIGRAFKGGLAVAGKGIRYVAPRAARLYAKGALAATAGAIGVAAGLASDDDRNILRYGAAGIGAGWLAGSGAINVVENADRGIRNTISSAASTYTLAAKGEEAERQRQIAIEERAAMKDKNRQRLYKEKLGLKNNEQVKAALEDARKFRENGIMDDELIIKAMDAEGFGDERASREKIILAGLASETKNDNKKIKDVQSRLQERGLSNDDVKKYIDGIRDITGAI